MADVTKLLVELGVKTDKLEAGLNQAKSKVENFGDTVRKIGTYIGVAFGTREILNFGKEAVKLVGMMEGVENAFMRLADEDILIALRKAVRGTMNDVELMSKAVLGANLGIPIKEMATLFEFASRRAQQTGEDIDYLVNSIVIGLGRKSPRVIDNLGISAERLKDAIGGVSFEEASVEQVTVGLGKIIQQEFTKMGAAVDTTTDKLARQQVNIDNLKIAIGKLITENKDFTDTLSTLNIVLTGITSLIDELKTGTDDLSPALQKVGKVAKNIAMPLAAPLLGLLRLTNKEVEFLNKLFKKEGVEAAGDFGDAIKGGVIPPIEKTIRTINVIKGEIEALEGKIGDAARGELKVFYKQLEKLNKELDTLSSKSILAVNFKAPFIESKVAIKESSEALNDWGDALTENVLAPEVGWGSITNQLSFGLQKVKTDADLLGESLQNVFGDAFMSALDAADNRLQAFFQTIFYYIKRLIAQQLALTVVKAVLGVLTGGTSQLTGFGATLFKGIKGFQHGGVVMQPTLALVGERGPEVITPLNKGLNLGPVEFRIRGEDLYWINRKQEYKLSRVT